jgi:hypothetical protein
VEGYLGLFDPKLVVGSTQQMVFGNSDKEEGPFHLNQQVETLDKNEGVDSKEQQLLFSEIEQLMKKFKCLGL